jgi:SAM-dependent methyltransferase
VESHEYQTLFEHEASYWWYRALHRVLLTALEREGMTHGSRILDAGCGTAQNLVNISQRITPLAFGADLSPCVIPYWKQRGLRRVCLASVNQLPFRDGSFDAVLSIDVLECDEVSQEKAYAELWRTAKEGSLIILVVPAYNWLLTKEHHRAVHASRRYTKHRLLALLETQPVVIRRVTYLFALLFPLIAGYRLGLRLRERRGSTKPRSELQPLSPFVNAALHRAMVLEQQLLKLIDLPFGSSLVAIMRKKSLL